MTSLMNEKRFLLVSIIPHDLTEENAMKNIRETIDLVHAYDGEVMDIVVQHREIHDKGMYIGRGKTEEVSQMIVDQNIEVIILNSIIKPTQIYDFYTIFEKKKRNIQVWDRVDLILKIFAKHANTAEAKLQIELAAMRHMGPRIYGMGIEMSRQSGQLGTRGVGETNTELMKRHLREQMRKTSQDLEKLSKDRQALVEHRQKIGLKTVSLIGYTNAGKTSLFNLLTEKKKLVKDQLFATLDSTTGKLYLPELGKEILVSDTIGFIRQLPPQLIRAFRSTLMESIYADLLIHIIDVSDPDMERKIRSVEKVLKSLRLEDKKRLYVFNKTDRSNGISKEEIKLRYASYNPLFISVKSGAGIEELKEEIARQI